MFFFLCSTVKFYMDMLVAWIRRYMKLSPQNSLPDVRQHGPFFSACQALFFIFVHRHEELINSFGEKVVYVFFNGLYQHSLLCARNLYLTSNINNTFGFTVCI